ncbi:MAG TPA: molybdopterin-binding protein [Firmicutes bacterium]|nr:molybdopterin-binding protein [Bacillota bacterium]
MRKVHVKQAVGLVLGQDLTKIVPGEFKGVKFKKGYIIKEEDIEELLQMGKEHVYIADLDEPYVHENEGAKILANAICGEGIELTGPAEGKVNLIASFSGVLKINLDALHEMNSIGELVVSTLHRNTFVERGKKVASAKIIPLVIAEEKIGRIRKTEIKYGKMIALKPVSKKKVGILITGTEVYEKRIEDGFAPVLKQKMEYWGCPIVDLQYSPDDMEVTAVKINEIIAKGAEIMFVTGGMAVDPDDVTLASIAKAGCLIENYGSPVLPGAVFLVAYKDNIPVIGLPACGMYHKATVFDILFPRFLAGERLTGKDIMELAHGGLCMECSECHYPVCPFGKA